MSTVLGLVLGNGRLPFEIAEAAAEQGLRLVIVALHDSADPALETLTSEGLLWARPGELNSMIEFFKKHGVTEVLLAGGITKSRLLQDPEALGADERTLKMLARLTLLGDDAILRAVAQEFESEGLPVIYSTQYLQNRLTPAGPLTRATLAGSSQVDLDLGTHTAKALGRYDVGQSVVVRDGAVLAVEAVEGTDATMRRAYDMCGPGAVLVKAAKPNQDLRFDVPAAGPTTIELAHECGIVGLALEAGRTIILERDRTIALANKYEIAIVGFRAEPS